MPDIPDTRKLVAEHLKFFGELGATGFRKDAAWALRTSGDAPDAAEKAEGRGQNRKGQRAEGRGQNSARSLTWRRSAKTSATARGASSARSAGSRSCSEWAIHTPISCSSARPQGLSL